MDVDPRQIELSRDQQNELAELSATTGKPWPVVLHEALDSFRHERSGNQNGGAESESFLEAAERLGLVGCLRGGPSDLSTNPAYMEGFGQSDG
jgi:hypothetical protein